MFSLKNVSPSITDMIRFDHSHVLLTWHQYVANKKPTVKQALGGAALAKSEPEHNAMREVIARIRSGDPGSTRYDQLVAELMRDVLKHVADEETVLLPDAERMLSTTRLNELGVAMTRRRAQLLAPRAGKIATSTLVGFSSSTTAVVGAALGALLLGRALSKRVTS